MTRDQGAGIDSGASRDIQQLISSVAIQGTRQRRTEVNATTIHCRRELIGKHRVFHGFRPIPGVLETAPIRRTPGAQDFQ
jgi:hypothetical protein